MKSIRLLMESSMDYQANLSAKINSENHHLSMVELMKYELFPDLQHNRFEHIYDWMQDLWSTVK